MKSFVNFKLYGCGEIWYNLGILSILKQWLYDLQNKVDVHEIQRDNGKTRSGIIFSGF